MTGIIPGKHSRLRLTQVLKGTEVMESQTPQGIEESEFAPGLQAIFSVPIHPTGIYTYKEAAALSKCSYVTIWRAVANGKLKATSVGNQPRIVGSKLLEWIEAGGETGRSKATM